MGGYGYHPSSPPAPSSFYDGTAWSTDPRVVLPGYPRGETGAGRYFIELRIVDPKSGQILAQYY
jgi:hypothetical protein